MTKPIIYSTQTCPFCKMAKAYFKDNNVEFDDRDVTHDEKLQQEMIEKSGQFAVPVLDIGGTIIVGFQKEKIEAALKASK